MAKGIPDYNELKLRIQRSPDDSYHVIVFGPDGSTATESFSLPSDLIIAHTGGRRTSGSR
jgi:hypothetical protein